MAIDWDKLKITQAGIETPANREVLIRALKGLQLRGTEFMDVSVVPGIGTSAVPRGGAGSLCPFALRGIKSKGVVRVYPGTFFVQDTETEAFKARQIDFHESNPNDPEAWEIAVSGGGKSDVFAKFEHELVEVDSFNDPDAGSEVTVKAWVMNGDITASVEDNPSDAIDYEAGTATTYQRIGTIDASTWTIEDVSGNRGKQDLCADAPHRLPNVTLGVPSEEEILDLINQVIDGGGDPDGGPVVDGNGIACRLKPNVTLDPVLIVKEFRNEPFAEGEGVRLVADYIAMEREVLQLVEVENGQVVQVMCEWITHTEFQTLTGVTLLEAAALIVA